MMELVKKILIADDEPGVVMILGMRLRANGYQVISAQDGATTIELARQEKPDLIILNIKMPGRDGYSVYEGLKTWAETTSIPVIFFSALPPEQAQQKTAQLGADGFVSKSSNPDEILTKIKEILNESNSQPTKQLASAVKSSDTGK